MTCSAPPAVTYEAEQSHMEPHQHHVWSSSWDVRGSACCDLFKSLCRYLLLQPQVVPAVTHIGAAHVLDSAASLTCRDLHR